MQMKGISAVSIIVLTVFLSLSAPAHAGTGAPYPIYGYVNYSDGAPADGALVTIYRAGDPLNNTTSVVGSSYGASGWWKADLYNIPPVGIPTIGSDDTIMVEVADDYSNTGVATLVVDTSIMGAHRVADVTAVGLPMTGDINGDGMTGGDDALQDAIHLLKYSYGDPNYPEIFDHPDCNGDGITGVAGALQDAIHLLKYSRGDPDYPDLYPGL
jgi:hypothetical protein